MSDLLAKFAALEAQRDAALAAAAQRDAELAQREAAWAQKEAQLLAEKAQMEAQHNASQQVVLDLQRVGAAAVSFSTAKMVTAAANSNSYAVNEQAFMWGEHAIAVTRVFEPGPRAVVAKCVVGQTRDAAKVAAAALMEAASKASSVAPASAAAVVAAPAPPPLKQLPLVLKFARILNSPGDIMKEKANLRKVAGIPHVVRAVDVAGTALEQDFLLVQEDGGTPLSSICMCDRVREKVLRLLETQIEPALKAIHERGFIFFDLHAGNVVCDNPSNPQYLALIDFESLTAIGDSLVGSPLKRAFDGERAPLKAQAAWDLKRLDELKTWVSNGGVK